MSHLPHYYFWRHQQRIKVRIFIFQQDGAPPHDVQPVLNFRMTTLMWTGLEMSFYTSWFITIRLFSFGYRKYKVFIAHAISLHELCTIIIDESRAFTYIEKFAKTFRISFIIWISIKFRNHKCGSPIEDKSRGQEIMVLIVQYWTIFQVHYRNKNDILAETNRVSDSIFFSMLTDFTLKQ